MEDQLITFETAKIAKELGFNERCLYFYTEEGELIDSFIECNRLGGSIYADDLLDNFNDGREFSKSWWFWASSDDKSKLSIYSAPDQSLLQKWLRDEANIELSIKPINNKSGKLKSYSVALFKFTFIGYETNVVIINHFNIIGSYKEALEKGLQKALKNLPG